MTGVQIRERRKQESQSQRDVRMVEAEARE